MKAAPRRPLITAATARWVIAVGVLVLLGLALVVFFWIERDGTTESLTSVSASDIHANPDRHLGERVIVRGRVQEVIGRQVFTLDAPELLVVGPLTGFAVPERGAESGLRPDDVVQVAGVVQMINLAEFEPAPGDEVRPEDLQRFAGLRPGITAQVVTLVPAENPDAIGSNTGSDQDS